MEILTWNMQGHKADTLNNVLSSGAYDVVCVQESTVPLASFDEVGMATRSHATYVQHYTSARLQSHSYTAYFVPWTRSEEGNPRCSLTTYVKNTRRHAFYETLQSYYDFTRPLLCVEVDGLIICNLHNISGNVHSAKDNMRRFIDTLNATRRQYCIAGDFNIDAFTHRDTISRDKHFYDPDTKTQVSGGCLDYMYSLWYVPRTISCQAAPGIHSDHSPVAFSI